MGIAKMKRLGKVQPHPSHQMTEWQDRGPRESYRYCLACCEEERKENGVHRLGSLEAPCT